MPTTGKTVPKQLTPWKPGQSGNPAGRPLGARHKLGEAFLEAMRNDFLENGVDAIVKVRQEFPAQYLKVIASILPKELHVKTDSLEDMPDDELLDILYAVRSLIAADGRKASSK